MNIIIAILIIVAFLSASIYFVYLTCKNIDKNNTTDSFMDDILAQAKGRNTRDLDSINQTIKNFYPVLKRGMKMQDMAIAADLDTCTKNGDDMFQSGKCHWCCDENSHNYLDPDTKKIFCYNDNDINRPPSFIKFEQDICSCTKENEDIKQYGICFPCCDGLNMYMSNDGSNRTQCFAGTGTISGYTYIPGNKCGESDRTQPYPKYPLITPNNPCTKENESVNQHQICFPCCDGLNMYMSNDGSKQTQCFIGTDSKTDYTYIPGNKCESIPL
jgi:hypothetical protein